MLRYWHTLRHLKPVQFYWRLWLKVYRPRVNSLASAPPQRPARRDWQTPVARASSMLAQWHFRFLNREHSLPAQGGWNDAGLDKLWLYNLHYFDDLNATGAGSRTKWHLLWLQRWVAENPPALGNGWEPYPTSLRIVNWVKWLLSGNQAPAGLLPSLAVQACWLCKRLEWHLLGNHLFANAKALVFAGLFFEGDEADAWLAAGLRIIERELPEQVLADGGNFERSTMYHAIILEDVLDLVNVARHWPDAIPESQVRAWRDVAGRMLNWLAGMVHPDGEISLFNDAALGVAPTLAALRSYAQRLGLSHVIASEARQSRLSICHFPDSGYVRFESDLAVALLDVAPVGPEYLPGHAHADTLSFELSVFGQRVVVNGGTSRYGVGPERQRERETAAHSTVEVARQSSSEVWGGFRVARRARPFDLQVKADPAQLQVACAHTGYMRLAGKPVHRRSWTMSACKLQVSDELMSTRPYPAMARYILHPAMQLVADGDKSWKLKLPGGQTVRIRVAVGHPRVEPANYAPEFGKIFTTQCLAVDLVDGRSQVDWTWG